MPKPILAFSLGLLSLATTNAVAAATNWDSYSVVNGQPQFSADEEHFSFYWSLWRGLSTDEKQALTKTQGGALVSQRNIAWSVNDCQTASVLHQAQETLWYLDDIKFDAEGQVIPLVEAPRAGFLYINMGTINSMGLRGLTPPTPLVRQAHEERSAFAKRQRDRFEQWRAQSSPRGTRGSLRIHAIHRLFTNDAAVERQAFIDFDTYAREPNTADPRYEALRADRWPVYHDERAHKPHTLDQPAGWDGGQEIAESTFNLRLEWDWCDASQPVKARIIVPPPGLPAPGPSRPGRPDAGTLDIPIVVGL